jgi:hypothetical protein
MPARILGEVGGLLEAVRRAPRQAPFRTASAAPAHQPRLVGSGAVLRDLCAGFAGGPPRGRELIRIHLICPSCGSSHVAQMLGDNGGVSYVCTACGHSWS